MISPNINKKRSFTSNQKTRLQKSISVNNFISTQSYQTNISITSNKILQNIENNRLKLVSQKRIELCKISDSKLWREAEEKRLNLNKGIIFQPMVF